MDNNQLSEYRLAQIEAKAKLLETEISQMKTEMAELEKRRLRAGLAALGTLVMLLGGIVVWVWQHSVAEAWEALRR